MIRQRFCAAVRKLSSGDEWIHPKEMDYTQKAVMMDVEETNRDGPTWAEKNPLVRIAKVEITEVQQ